MHLVGGINPAKYMGASCRSASPKPGTAQNVAILRCPRCLLGHIPGCGFSKMRFKQDHGGWLENDDEVIQFKLRKHANEWGLLCCANGPSRVQFIKIYYEIGIETLFSPSFIAPWKSRKACEQHKQAKISVMFFLILETCSH